MCDKRRESEIRKKKKNKNDDDSKKMIVKNTKNTKIIIRRGSRDRFAVYKCKRHVDVRPLTIFFNITIIIIH